MSGSNVKNILVLGTKGVDTLKYTNLFGTYLKYDTYEDSTYWESILSQSKVINDIKSSILIIGNKKLNFIHAPAYRHDVQQISSILLHFMNKQKITAVIFLIKSSEMDNECIWKYKNSLLSNLKQFANRNILYLIVAKNDSYKREQFILGSICNSFCEDRKVFYFQEETFHKVSKDNWQENVEFSKSIYNYIVGDGKNDGLQDYYIQSVIPPTSLLKLVDDLLIFLIQIYICAEYGKLSYNNNSSCFFFYLDGYKKNVITCYGNCNEWMQHLFNKELKLKIPKICHAPCKCTEFDADVSKCTRFDTPDQTCLQCDCKSDTHTKNYFTYGSTCTSGDFNDKCIAIKILTTFYIYKKQNQEVYNFENVFLRLLDMQDVKHRAIFDNFKKEFEEIVQKLDQKSNPITSENILTSLKELYQITGFSHITPEFIGGIFPKDFHLEIISNEQNNPNQQTEVNVKCETLNIKNVQTEIQLLKNEVAELKHMFKEFLNKFNFSNANNLNSNLNPDAQASTSLNQSNEKEVNWNIETK